MARFDILSRALGPRSSVRLEERRSGQTTGSESSSRYNAPASNVEQRAPRHADIMLSADMARRHAIAVNKSPNAAPAAIAWVEELLQAGFPITLANATSFGRLLVNIWVVDAEASERLAASLIDRGRESMHDWLSDGAIRLCLCSELWRAMEKKATGEWRSIVHWRADRVVMAPWWSCDALYRKAQEEEDAKRALFRRLSVERADSVINQVFDALLACLMEAPMLIGSRSLQISIRIALGIPYRESPRLTEDLASAPRMQAKSDTMQRCCRLLEDAERLSGIKLKHFEPEYSAARLAALSASATVDSELRFTNLVQHWRQIRAEYLERTGRFDADTAIEWSGQAPRGRAVDLHTRNELIRHTVLMTPLAYAAFHCAAMGHHEMLSEAAAQMGGMSHHDNMLWIQQSAVLGRLAAGQHDLVSIFGPLREAMAKDIDVSALVATCGSLMRISAAEMPDAHWKDLVSVVEDVLRCGTRHGHRVPTSCVQHIIAVLIKSANIAKEPSQTFHLVRMAHDVYQAHRAHLQRLPPASGRQEEQQAFDSGAFKILVGNMALHGMVDDACAAVMQFMRTDLIGSRGGWPVDLLEIVRTAIGGHIGEVGADGQLVQRWSATQHVAFACTVVLWAGGLPGPWLQEAAKHALDRSDARSLPPIALIALSACCRVQALPFVPGNFDHLTPARQVQAPPNGEQSPWQYAPWAYRQFQAGTLRMRKVEELHSKRGSTIVEPWMIDHR